jgi:hypothetical protein
VNGIGGTGLGWKYGYSDGNEQEYKKKRVALHSPSVSTPCNDSWLLPDCIDIAHGVQLRARNYSWPVNNPRSQLTSYKARILETDKRYTTSVPVPIIQTGP